MAKSNQKLWVITDGKIGDVNQCLGIAEALGGHIHQFIVSPRKLYSLLSPWGPVDHKALNNASQFFLGPFPDIAIASGRRAVPYLRYLKKKSNNKTLTVFLKDPRVGCKAADLIWVNSHDKLRGKNVLVTSTGPHRITERKLEMAAKNAPSHLRSLKQPRTAVLVGGNSRHHFFSESDIQSFAQALKQHNKTHSLMITASRRTPAKLAQILATLGEKENNYLWDGSGDNPLLPFLALSDNIIVTTDSANMLGEAAVTGKPIYGFQPSGGHPKFEQLTNELKRLGALTDFPYETTATNYEPINATPIIANWIRKQLDQRNNKG
ncbi:mitochondrial fission ELM1 family protein [Polycladidibacter stylochi]|uniref:mitochondrial fission ELM1 family protein n=1 Tax=Polycladidibacter stylochi TaxID=1807766 RepID=UPI00082B3D30|nr:mitochondrial fission ELM1 family protein [Pseudovibrio stylochi]